MGGLRAWGPWWQLLWPLALCQMWAEQERCPVVTDVDPSVAICANFSGGGFQPRRNQTLRGGALRVLDLSANGLARLPATLVEALPQLQLLIVTDNPLRHVDEALAERCALELRADCGCHLAAWQRVRQGRCAHQPSGLCLRRDAGSPQNVSDFLLTSCGWRLSGWTPLTIGVSAAAGLLGLLLLVASPLLIWVVWRRRRCQAALRSPDKAPVTTGTRAGGSQSRYSTRKPAAPAAARRSTSDYENVFVGQLPQDPPSDPIAAESDFYMNFKVADADSQPVYCNLEDLRPTREYEEEYVMPNC